MAAYWLKNSSLIGCMPQDEVRLPTSPIDPRFGTITEVVTVANSNYNGLTASLRHQFHSMQVQANYTWSHALDEVSNAGFLPYTFNTNH